ncbi:hypothetical protein B0H16DRAFT_1748596 [Mycena metata]|uniref:Uncharacterized protein n=1 Tax=Mycena metata TaxID=1033252 RepID=A0AAD7DXQ2_9AGAR|nr:hypothetical protein B0H16DRAFT_1748596 [Mycena metata]
MARRFPRAVNPFLDLGLTMSLGANKRWGSATTTAPSNEIVVPQSQLDEQQVYINAFNSILAISADSVDVLRELYKDDGQWRRKITKFRDTASSARQSDTNGLKKLNYLPADSATPIIPAIQASELKSDRGIYPMLWNAIIPWSLRLVVEPPTSAAITEDDTHEEAEEPETVRSVFSVSCRGHIDSQQPFYSVLKALLHEGTLLNGKSALTASKYPSCFYPDEVYNPRAPEVGLLRSLFLLLVTRHIWTSPRSAFDGAQKLKARTILSTSEWTCKDGKYNYELLFNAVVKVFENPTSPWTVETLAWYKKGVSGNCEERRRSLRRRGFKFGGCCHRCSLLGVV